MAEIVAQTPPPGGAVPDDGAITMTTTDLTTTNTSTTTTMMVRMHDHDEDDVITVHRHLESSRVVYFDRGQGTLCLNSESFLSFLFC